MVFEKAWHLLKASRQTELGEFHPQFPSSYGPMTAISRQPSQATIDNRMNDPLRFKDFDKKYTQPYESFVHQGMVGKPPSPNALDWEEAFREKQPHIKPFTFEEGDTGNWFRPAQKQMSPSQYTMYKKMLEMMGFAPSKISRDNPERTVGVRMPLDESMGMFRDKGYEGENAEAFIYGDIPPERLVMVPGTVNSASAWSGGLGRVDE